MIIRRMLVTDWREVRALRLTALREAPSAYGFMTYDEQAAVTEAEWRRLLAPDSPTGAVFGAALPESCGPLVGLCGGFVASLSEVELLSGRERSGRAGSGGVVDLVYMWVNQAARRLGVGQALVGAVVDWARTQGFSHVHLVVTEGNTPAERLYALSGFVVNGERRPHPSHPGLSKVGMVLPLD